MPEKLGKGGAGMQNYVPAGNGDASGEYGDNASGSNVHFKAFAKKQNTLEVKSDKGGEVKLQKTKNATEKEEKKPSKAEKQEEKGDISKNQQIKPLNSKIKDVSLLSGEEKYEYLMSFNGEFDVEKIKNLSDEELTNLVVAKQNLQELDKKINKDIDKKYIKELEELQKENHIWNFNSSIPKSFEQAKSSIDKKLDYFATKDTPENQEKAQLLKDFKENQIPKWEKDYEKIEKLKEDYKETASFLDKYIDKDSLYSQTAKDNAIWFKKKEETWAYFGKENKEFLNSLPSNEKDTLKKYTGSPSSINEPLRNLTYYGKSIKKETFIEDVKNMTSAISKSKLKDNMWVQRGVSQLSINGNILNYNEFSENLVGQTFVDNGFVSCGGAKGTGFLGKDIIMNIYCPKGTQGLYVDPISYYEGTSENEIILQRGYSYKITKVEKGSGKTYIDCEVLLGTDEQKYSDKELENLQKKNFSVV